MSTTRQTSFAAGELSPYLHGRSDLELYAHGARTLLNFVINRQGAAVSRPGGQFGWTAKATGMDIVLLPLVDLSGTSYVLEFGHLYCRVYFAGSMALAQELVTPFQVTDLPGLQWAQVGAEMLIASPNRPMQQIRTGAVWTIIDARYAPPGDTLGGPPLEAVMPSIGGAPPALPVLVAWQPTSLFVVDAAHPPREWRYKVSTIVRHVLTGEEAETLPRDITQYSEGNATTGNVATTATADLPGDNLLVLFDDAPIYIAPGHGAAVTPPANWAPVSYVYYRGRGELFGLIGASDSNNLFADFADEPNYASPPLRGESPFAAGEHPACVAFWQQRRVLAGTSSRPSTLWTSAVDEFENYDAPVKPYAGQPLEATLAHRKREHIVALFQSESLLVFTDNSVWAIGRPDVATDFDTLPGVTRVIDEVGALPIMPLDVDGSVLYVRSKGRGVRALQPSQTGASFQGADISWHAEHLLRGSDAKVISWCYQRDPWGVVWMVLESGELLSCTPTGSTYAWARHELGARAMSVACVPQSATGDCDVLFVAVLRGGQRRVERFVPHTIDAVPTYPSDPDYDGNLIGALQRNYPLDSYVTAIITKATGTTVSGLTHLEGKAVWVSCPGIDPAGPFTVAGGAITTPAGWGPTGQSSFYAAVGLNYVADVELLDAPQKTQQKTVVRVGFEVDRAVGLEVGEDFDHLVPWRQREVSDSYEYPSAATALVTVAVRGAWRKSGRAVLRKATPEHVTVLGITRELEGGGPG